MSRSLNYLGGVFVAGLLLSNSACTAKQTSQATIAAAQPSAPAPAQQPADAHSAKSQVQRITVAELKQLIAKGQVLVVDVRGADAYNIEHIKGSINLPLDKIQAGEYKKLPRDKRIVTYCSCGTEGTSAAAAAQLENAGFKNTAALLGGTNAWKQSGGEMEKASPKA
jgi:rhodanese-related sulfurtransferase